MHLCNENQVFLIFNLKVVKNCMTSKIHIYLNISTNFYILEEAQCMIEISWRIQRTIPIDMATRCVKAIYSIFIRLSALKI